MKTNLIGMSESQADQLLVESDEESSRAFVALCHTSKCFGIACFDEVTNTILCDAINASEGQNTTQVN